MIGILDFSVPRERFTHAIEHGPEHFRPVLQAARDYGVGVCVVPQGAERFNPPRKRPNIVIVGDDMHEAMGPDAFHRKSLVRFIKRRAALSSSHVHRCRLHTLRRRPMQPCFVRTL